MFEIMDVHQRIILIIITRNTCKWRRIAEILEFHRDNDNQRLFVLEGLRNGGLMVSVIEKMTSQRLFIQMEQRNGGLMVSVIEKMTNLRL